MADRTRDPRVARRSVLPRHRAGSAGFTLVEVTIIVLVLAVLAGILVPNIGAFNRWARFIRVKADLRVLCPMMKVMLDDTAESAFFVSGNLGIDTPRRRDTDPIGLLFGDGDIPDDGGVLDSDDWRLTAGETFTEVTNGPQPITVTFTVDTFANHLIQNTPLDDPANRYRLPGDMIDSSPSSQVVNGLRFDPVGGEAFNSLFAWRGPYLNDRVYPDPWGNRYMANVFALFIPQAEAVGGGLSSRSEGFSSAVVCYSAGPDEELDTEFNQPVGWFTGGDDYTVVFAGAGGISAF